MTAQEFLDHPGPTLDLSRDYLGGNGVLLLLESAGPAVCRQLQTVNLKMNGITNEPMIGILRLLIGSELEELMLDGNCFGRKTITAFKQLI